MLTPKNKARSFMPGFLLIFLLVFSGSLSAQIYNPQKAFDPSFLNNPGTAYRNGDGAPGPAYWQNETDYKIEASLDAQNHGISGKEVITYTNNSPDDLHYLWLQLDQNLYKQQSRGVQTIPAGGRSYAPRKFYGGFKISSVKIKLNESYRTADYVISDTRMQIRLPKALKAKGKKAKIKIKYRFIVPEYGVDIMGRNKTNYGWIYEIAQWYPRMAVYDDVRGWNTLPFLGAGEFYLDDGHFEVTLDVPANFIVAASGKLQNPKDVLTGTQITRLKQARNRTQSVAIRTPDEVKKSSTEPSQKRKQWHFTLDRARDFSWAASSAFAWDASRVDLPYGQHTMAMAVYPPGSAGQDRWGRATEYVKASLKFYSEQYDYNYPYPVAVSVAGSVGGMEYPGIVFCSMNSHDSSLWGVITHEFGHTWFPMVVGSNERRYAWMDEGFNTLMNYYATQHFNHGEYAHPFNSQRVIRYMTSPDTEPIMTHADALQTGHLGSAAYGKPAMGLHMLREDILGPETFDRSFNTYIKRWAFKHPQPKDFFRTMNDASGENLNWFWKEWFYKTWTLDQAVSDIREDSTGSALISLQNKGQIVMPVQLRIWESNGDTANIKLPVEIWQRGDSWTFKYKAKNEIDSVKVDPNRHFPDVNRTNNSWKAKE